MRLYLLLVVFLCLSQADYAAFPVKRSLVTSVVARDEGQEQVIQTSPKRGYSNTVAIILAALSVAYGGLGLHRYYLGYIGDGILQSLGFPAIIAGVFIIFAHTVVTAEILLAVLLMTYGLCMWYWQVVDLVRLAMRRLQPKKKRWR